MRVVILWFIGFNGVIHWSLCWRGLGVTLSGLAFVTSLISVITPCTPSKIFTHYWVGPHKIVSNRVQLLLTPALIPRTLPSQSLNKSPRFYPHNAQWQRPKLCDIRCLVCFYSNKCSCIYFLLCTLSNHITYRFNSLVLNSVWKARKHRCLQMSSQSFVFLSKNVLNVPQSCHDCWRSNSLRY